MTLSRDTIGRIVELAKPSELVVDNETFVTGKVQRPPEDLAAAIKLYSLLGLVEFLKLNVDKLELDHHFVQVVDAQTVKLRGALTRQRQRETVAMASCKDFWSGHDRQVWAREELQIALQTIFTDAGDRAEVLRLVGNVRAGEERIEVDDGVSQAPEEGVGEVVVKHGAAAVERELVRTSYDLAPYRTFREVSQPVSPFVLRFSGTSEVLKAGLLCADGGAWEIEARASIKLWLDAQLDGLVEVIS